MSSIEVIPYLRHFRKEYSQQIWEFADKMFPDYIFTRREGKQQYGYCTACRNEFKTYGLRHMTITKCPGCKEKVTVQSSGMGRSKMVNEAYFIYFEKSAVDPDAIVARGIHGAEDYRGKDYKQVRPKLTDRTLYVFKIGESVMLKRYAFYSWHEHDMYPKGFDFFEKARTVYSELSTWGNNHYLRGFAYYSRDSIAEAVKDTPFRYSCWQSYNDEPMVKFFDLYSKYPKAVEYLTKLGLEWLIDAKLTGDPTCGAVNWRGKTVFDMLRVNRAELKMIRSSDMFKDSPLYLRLYQINRNDRNRFTLQELKEVEKAFGLNQIKDIYVLTKYSTLKKSFNYIKTQFEKCRNENDQKHFYSMWDTINNYRDYLNDCKTLEWDMKNEHVLFPKNLYSAHQNTIAQVEVKKNEHLEKHFKARYASLDKKYHFEHDGLIIRPVKSVKELIKEGKELNHCVGRYAERHANGHCSIFLIRKASKPDKPYYTLELFDNRIIQVRGKYNCAATPKINSFLEAWTETEIFQKKNKQKTKITVPA